jgi:ribosome-associated protein
MSLNKIEYKLEGEYIELCQLLKAANICGSGGEAKVRIADGEAFVNETLEIRKRRKMRLGDVVIFDGWQVTVA